MDSSSVKRFPWINWEEWIGVKDACFSCDNAQIARAVEIMDMWASREALPAAIESTLEFLRIESTANDSHVKRVLLSNAFLRMVNGYTDPHQKGTARSTSSIGAELSMPPMFIEIRHNATHRQLPTLQLLEDQVPLAMEFLRTSYWETQHQRLLVRVEQIQNLANQANQGEVFIFDKVRSRHVSTTAILEVLIPLLFSSLCVQDPVPLPTFTMDALLSLFQKRLKTWKSQFKGLQYLIPSFYIDCLRQIYHQLSTKRHSEWTCAFLCCWHNYLSGKCKEVYNDEELRSIMASGIQKCQNGDFLEARWTKQLSDNFESTFGEENLNFDDEADLKEMKSELAEASDSTNCVWGTLK